MMPWSSPLRSFPWRRWLCAAVATVSFAGVAQAQLDDEPRPWVMYVALYLSSSYSVDFVSRYDGGDSPLLEEFKRTKQPIYAGAIEFQPDQIILRSIGAMTDEFLLMMLRRNVLDSIREVRMPHHPIPARRTRDGPVRLFFTIPFDSPDAPEALLRALSTFGIVRLTCGKPFDPDWRPGEADYKIRRHWFDEPCER